MDHAEVREILELAATEPGGADELLAGASAEALGVHAHVAGCPSCRAELDELRRSSATIRDVIRTTPTAALRERTLSLVSTAGRVRSGEPASAAAIAAPAGPRQRRAPMSWVPALTLGGLAAAALAGIIVWRTVDARLTAADMQIAEQREAIAGLTAVADWTLRLGTAPDATLVRLAPSNGSSATGTVLYSADRGQLVMTASDLPAPPAGQEYRCWIDQGDGPLRIGKMYPVGPVAYWGGEVERLHGISGALTFGVSLVDETGEGGASDVVLAGAS
jgi:hypothetical protein